MNIKWMIRFLKLSKEISTWSKDPSSKVGCVLVNEDRKILATGYNGFPASIEDSEEILNTRELKYDRIIHAEMNAILNALSSGTKIDNSIAFIYRMPPCVDCTKHLIQSGIKTIVTINPESLPDRWKDHWENRAKPILKEANIDMIFLEEGDLE